jgi:ribonuclease BN (tRNA processing enzyme)
MPVAGPSDLVARVAEVYGAHDEAELDELRTIFAFSEVSEGASTIGPFSITARQVDHPVEAYAFRIEHGGRTLVYSGDCAPCPGLDDVARDADVALIEAAYTEDPHNRPGVHHTGREAGELAARCGVGRLVVTHVPPWLDREEAAAAARTAFAGPVDVARPDDSYEV